MAAQMLAIFITVFLAELGDKTQLATILFAADGKLPPLLVFVAAGLALVVATALAVLSGSLLSRYMDVIPLKLIAGIGFVLIGLWTITEYIRGS